MKSYAAREDEAYKELAQKTAASKPKSEPKKDPTCKDRVKEHYKDRIEDITTLWELYKKDPEADDEDLGNWSEYGLSFDYVAPETFTNQRRGYWRYQLSWGGPSDEFRFYADENLNVIHIEYWFLDWFDGAKVVIDDGKNFNLLNEIWEDLKETGTVEHVRKEAMTD